MNARLDRDRGGRRIGVIQGRLSARPEGGLQAFPSMSWEREFRLARELGLSCIEWVFEAPGHEQNPLRSSKGRARIRKVCQETGVTVRSVCGDYFMVHRLSEQGESGIEASFVLSEVIAQCAAIGAHRILLPWLEEAALDTPEKLDAAVNNITRALPAAVRHDVMLGLEMEIPGLEYRAVIDRIGHPLVRAYYDTGNSTAAGFDVEQDIEPLLDCLGALHIKDRLTQGGSQFLGRGDTNFKGLFAKLRASGFEGDLVLQHYFEDPVEDARRAHEFIRNLWPATVG